jgi:hypothetical protein
MLPPHLDGGATECRPGSAGLGRGQADRARERLEGEGDTGGEVDAAAVTGARGLDARDVQPGLGELLGEQPEAGDDRRPAPVARAQLEDLDRQHVARLRVLHEHRSGDGVHAREVERGHRAELRIAVQLAARGVTNLELDVVT